MRDTKKVKCGKCYRLLCKRVPVHLGDDESWIVHVRHAKMELWTYDCTISCASCKMVYRVNGEDGIIGTEEKHGL